MNDRSYEDAVRNSVAASAASVLEAGPGRFDFREAQRLGSHVTLDRLEPVRQDA
jgi:fructose-1-phosphate kinase PfkB-like protein